jgi:hypothetical protein
MRAAFAIGALLALAGCGGGGEGETTTTTGTVDTLVRYQRGGGIAATYVEVVVGGDGAATFTSGYPQQNQRRGAFTVPEAELETLRGAVDAAQPLAVEETETVCADCFEYSLRIGDDEIEFDSVDLDEGNVSPEVGDLTARLEELAEQHARAASGSA